VSAGLGWRVNRKELGFEHEAVVRPAAVSPEECQLSAVEKVSEWEVAPSQQHKS
jgi:hypothetical protein